MDIILQVYREGAKQFKTAYLNNFPLATTLTDLKMLLLQATSLLDGSQDAKIGFFKGKEKVWIKNDRRVETLFSNDSELILWAEPAEPTKVSKVTTKRDSLKVCLLLLKIKRSALIVIQALMGTTK